MNLDPFLMKKNPNNKKIVSIKASYIKPKIRQSKTVEIITKEIKITTTAPTNCTDEQFLEWIEFCTDTSSSIRHSNPLHEYDMDAEEVDIN